jgi:pimeloyl-ACP methyl ester carboxylesterase
MFSFARRIFGFADQSGYGARPPLVLINGLAEQAESWFLNTQYWRRWFDVYLPEILVYDGPVCQARLASGGGITVDFLTDRLARFLDEFVQKPPYRLVASSLGGQIAAEYAARYPDKVDRLVMLCPAGMGSEERLPIAEGVRNRSCQALVGSVFHDCKRVPGGVAQYYERKFASKAWRKALFETVRSTKGHTVRDRLPQIKCPALVICGSEDKIVDNECIVSACAGLPNFRLVMLPGCGHAPQVEFPQVVNSLVARFLRESSPVPEAPAPEPVVAGAAVA